MSVPVEKIPTGLQQTISKVSSFKKQTIKCNVTNGQIANPGDSIEVDIPTKNIIDMRNIIFQTNVVLDAGATGGSNMPDIELFVRRLSLDMSGQTVVDIDYYNDIYNLMLNSTCSTACQRQRCCYSNDAFGLKSRLDLVDVTGLTALQYASLSELTARAVPTAATTGYITRDCYENCVDGNYRANMTSFLGIQDLGYLDTSILPAMKLRLQLAGNNVLGQYTGGEAASYLFNTMSLLVPVIVLPSYTNTLLQILTPDEQGNSESLYYKFTHYQTYFFGTNNTNLNSLKFSLATSCLDRLWLTMKPTGFATQGETAVGFPIKYFINTCYDTANANAEIQYITCTIDGTNLDSYKDDLRYNLYARNLAELNALNSTQYDNLVDSNGLAYPGTTVYTRSQFKRAKWFYCKSLAFEADHTAMSGYNTMSQTASVNIDVEFNAAPAATLSFLVFAECSRLLKVSAGRTIELVI